MGWGVLGRGWGGWVGGWGGGVGEGGGAAAHRPSSQSISHTSLYFARPPLTALSTARRTGITAYVLISGFFPFGTASDALTHQASFSGGRWGAGGDMATPREKLARCFVSSLLQHDPGERPGPGAAIQHEWLRMCVLTTKLTA